MLYALHASQGVAQIRMQSTSIRPAYMLPRIATVREDAIEQGSVAMASIVFSRKKDSHFTAFDSCIVLTYALDQPQGNKIHTAMIERIHSRQNVVTGSLIIWPGLSGRMVIRTSKEKIDSCSLWVYIPVQERCSSLSCIELVLYIAEPGLSTVE